jgi:hypothetical protein
MERSRLYPICIIIIIFIIILRSNIQGFVSLPKTIIILGDSILKNNNYVAEDKSVEFLLSANIKKTKNKLLFLAKDDSRISDLEEQVSGIVENNKYIFISSGGNDILQYVYSNSLNSSVIKTLFNKYKDTVNRIIGSQKPSRIYLLNLYFPTHSSIQPFYKYIIEWNNLLEEFCKSTSSSELIRVNEICNTPEDFTDIIEPSEQCSEKIANKIFSIL